MKQTQVPESSDIKALFNKIAPVYDNLNNWLSLGQHRVWKLMAVKWCQPSPEDIALDVCCGSGDITELLAKQIPQGKVFGVDFAKSQLEIAKEKATQKYPHLPITWIEADALNLPFEDNYFDCATMGYGLRNVKDIPACLVELHRVLKPGAKAAILDFNHPDGEYLLEFQKWYLNNIVVSVAEYFNQKEEYAYINPSLDRFPKAQEQIEIAKAAGFDGVCHYPIVAGMMGVLVVTKWS